jgi:hypothetical protein
MEKIDQMIEEEEEMAIQHPEAPRMTDVIRRKCDECKEEHDLLLGCEQGHLNCVGCFDLLGEDITETCGLCLQIA